MCIKVFKDKVYNLFANDSENKTYIHTIKHMGCVVNILHKSWIWVKGTWEFFVLFIFLLFVLFENFCKYKIISK